MKKLILISLLFAGCAGMSTQQKTTLITGVESLALNAAIIAASSATNNGQVDTATLFANSIQGGASIMQTLIDYQRQNAATAAELKTTVAGAIKDGSASPAVDTKVAPAVAKIVADAVANGQNPNDVIASAASGLDKAAPLIVAKAQANAAP